MPSSETIRLRVLLSAYACAPGMGSEPGVGWNLATQLARHHDLWVLAHAAQRDAIEDALPGLPEPRPRFVFVDVAGWRRRALPWPTVPNYVAWQDAALAVARKLHREVGFQLAHHATYVKYAVPSLLAGLELPRIWGPVGGAELAPAAFHRDFAPRARLHEAARKAALALGERSPAVRRLARQCDLAFATTAETAARLTALGARRVEILGESGLDPVEIARLAALPPPPDGPLRVMGSARLLHWKGVHLGLMAFAAAELPDAEYVIAGTGPERRRLERLVGELGVAGRVRFLGELPRDEVLATLATAHLLLHPSLHDSGGWVCLEAMAAGRPVVCLDLGGPGQQVTAETGFRIAATDRGRSSPDRAIADMAAVLRLLDRDRALLRRLGEGGRRRVAACYDWARKADMLADRYREVALG